MLVGKFAERVGYLGRIHHGHLRPATWFDLMARRVERNQILARALRDAGLEGGQADTVLSALEGVFDVRKSREGDQLRLVFRDGELDCFRSEERRVGKEC